MHMRNAMMAVPGRSLLCRALVLAALLLTQPTTARTSAAPATASMEAIRAADLRVATIGERLSIANLLLCADTMMRTGLVLHDIRQYSTGTQASARAVFGFPRDIAVEAVVPGSGAERAGVRADMALDRIDGDAVTAISPDTTEDNEDFRRLAGVMNRIDNVARGGGAVPLDVVTRDGAVSHVVIMPHRGCATRFQLLLGAGSNGFANGTYAQVASGLYDEARSDDELAAAMAHEFAHNVLRHRARLDALGADRGLLGGFGRNARLILATENEADRLSLYLMANAGFDPAAAIPFWDRFIAKHGFGAFADGTHLGRTKRVAQFRAELEALKALRAKTPAGEVLVPAFAKQPFAPLG